MTQERKPTWREIKSGKLELVVTDKWGSGSRLLEQDYQPLMPTDIAELSLVDRRELLEQRVTAYQALVKKEAERQSVSDLSHEAVHLASLIFIWADSQAEVKGEETHKFKQYQIHKQRSQSCTTRAQKKEENTRWSLESQQLIAQIEAQQEIRDGYYHLLIKKMFFEADGLNQMMLAAQELLEQNLITAEQWTKFLKQTKKFLIKLEPEAVGFYRYKRLPDKNLISAEQAQLLEQLVRARYQSNPDNQFLDMAQQIAEKLEKYYQKNLDRLYAGKEATPLLAFAYDWMLAVFLTDDLAIIQAATEEINKFLVKNKNQVEQELLALAEQSRKQAKARFEQVKQINRETGGNGTHSSQVVEKINPFADDYHAVVTPAYDRVTSLDAFFNFIQDLLGKKTSLRRIFNEVRQELTQDLTQSISGLEAAALLLEEVTVQDFALTWRSLMPNQFPQLEWLDKHIARFLEPKKLQQRKADLTGGDYLDQEFHRQQLQDMAELRDQVPAMTFSRLLDEIRMMMVYMGQKDVGLNQIEQIREGTAQRLHQVFHHNRWFVATWGDRFEADTDKELAELGLESLTFYPLDQEERLRMKANDSQAYFSYKVELKIKGMQDLPEGYDQVTLYFDENGQLYLSNSDQAFWPYWVTVPLKNLLARRLEFITSGPDETTSSDGQAAETGTQTRRAHWRTLPQDYGLTSESAQQHAQEVFEMYGVDIFKRNLVLRADNPDVAMVTFVRPTQLEKDQPNVLVYEEDRLSKQN